MTGNSTGDGHSVSIPIALYSHRTAIDQDMTGAVCFSVCFYSYFCWKTLCCLFSLCAWKSKHTLFRQTIMQETSINELSAASAHGLSTPWAWRAGCDKVLPFWGQTEVFQASGGSKLLWTHIVYTDYYLSSSETLGYLLWAAVAREDSPEAAGRMCHYQECQHSFWVIINNICMTARTVFVLQLAPCPAVIHCLLLSCT